MSWVLSLDTSGAQASLALRNLTDEHAPEWFESVSSAQNQDEELSNLVRALAERAGCAPNDLRSIVVGEGPGSFTGLRIGFSFAMGIAYALGIPLVTIPSLPGAAFEYRERGTATSPVKILVLSDARRNEFFSAAFESDGVRLLPLADTAIRGGEVLCSLIATSDIIVSRDSEELLSDLLGEARAKLVAPSHIARSLTEIALAEGKLDGLHQSVVALSELAPNYLRAVAAKKIVERGGKL